MTYARGAGTLEAKVTECLHTLAPKAVNRTDTHWITWRGRTQDIRSWADEVGISYYTLRARLLNYGWPVERALTEAAYVGRNQYAA